MSSGWFSRHVVLPVMQNVLGGGAVAGLVLAAQGGHQAAKGCSKSVEAKVVQGEQLLALGNADKAVGLSADALAISPESPCAHLLAADLAEAQWLKARRRHNTVEVERQRFDCYLHALKAQSLLTDSTRVTALLLVCAADTTASEGA